MLKRATGHKGAERLHKLPSIFKIHGCVNITFHGLCPEEHLFGVNLGRDGLTTLSVTPVLVAHSVPSLFEIRFGAKTKMTLNNDAWPGHYFSNLI